MNEKNIELIDGLKLLTSELKSAQVILYQRTLKRILRYVVSNNELKFITTHCNAIHNYNDLLESACSGKCGLPFVLPTEPYKVVSLVTGLLYNVDRDNIDFLAFLKISFPQEAQPMSQFKAFCDYVMVEYYNAFEKLLCEDATVVNVEVEAKDVILPSTLLDQLSPFILAVSEQILIDKTISEVKRAESIAVLDGLCLALEKGNSLFIKAMCIGLKYTLAGSKQHNSHVKGIETVLVDFGVL